ncbi:hypothetical protein D5R81_16900 [Parashewanella spongiae]|uniref:Lipoprotein n=1 Tax=Parashewanella spongiae TaxID=342950 RepID=A0A3A6TFM6_9GAMM|nr:hypothetical protein [Parashewanella spongiae]MCL1079716.1 hypothetical protein [Parashewanella spongiae]RJY07005.1 hypothetical protein D5R81_16900 [Parashewanella spongiae]
MLKRVFSLIIGFSLLTGCASVPLTTLFIFSHTDREVLEQANAEQLRAKITYKGGIKLESDVVLLTLSYRLKEHGSNALLKFPLQLVSHKHKDPKQGWIIPTPEKNIYTFKLNSENQKVFLKTKQDILKDGLEVVNFNVDINLGKGHVSKRDDESYRVSIDLKLNQNEEYFTLVRNADVIVE